MITVVNMLPNSQSDEQNQDAEPGISVNPANPNEMIATAFTYDNPAGSSAVSPQMTGDWAPIFYSVDGGDTWELRNVLPSQAGAVLPTGDVTVRFAGSGGHVYSGLISMASGSIIIARAPDANTQMVTLDTQNNDQPFVEATTVLGSDRVFVGYNSFSDGATVDQSQDAATAAAPAGFAPVNIDARTGSSGPKTRAAIHSNGTIYVAFYSMRASGNWDLVVVKDTNWGTSTPPYEALTDPGDGVAGKIVAPNITLGPSNTKDADFGHDRRGWELALAVDPNNDQRLYIVYSTATGAADYTLHLRRSDNGGQDWQADARTIVKAKNPGVAINDLGEVGFMYQQVVGATGASNWVTKFEKSGDDFTNSEISTLANVPSGVPVPAAVMATYIGDYTRLEAFGKNFYGIFPANNTPDPANFPSGVTFRRNVDSATNTLRGNDGMTAVPASIDPFFFADIRQDCVITTDRSTFGKDEVDAMLLLSNPDPAAVDAAFYVVIEGFRATDLGITAATLTGIPDVSPAITFSPALGQITARATSCTVQGNTLTSGRQRFIWTYEMRFVDSSDFTAEVIPVTMTASMTSSGGTMVSGDALITLTTQPNPYEIDGPTSWLSVDLQVFQVLENGSLPSTPGISLTSGPNTFIQALLSNTSGGGGYNDPTLPRAPGHPFDVDLVANEDTSTVQWARTVSVAGTDTPVFNFAVARVRYRALMNPAPNVRAFFRLFQASTTSTEFQPATTYATGGVGTTKVPLLGVINNEVVTIPCFAQARVDPTNPQGLNAQTDPLNVGPVGASIPADASGNEVQVYFGCWLDINQNVNTLPLSPTSAAGPFTPEQSIQQAIRTQHQCLVAEINLDPPEPQIANNASPASSDKLAQRNLTIVGIASPHVVPHTFDIKPTSATLPTNKTPDEIMIDWGNLPSGTDAKIYLPGTSADTILNMANRLYAYHGLSRIDAHTLSCQAKGITFMPIPRGVGSNYAGLLTIELPETVKRDRGFRVLARQITNASSQRPSTSTIPGEIEWRKVLGSFQLNIPKMDRASLLESEERLLSVLRWVALTIPNTNRWYPIFQRYLDQIGGRVGSLGGDPSLIGPSPDGNGRSPVCRRIGWLVSFLIALVFLLLALAPAVWGPAFIVFAIVVLLVLTWYWASRCKPSFCNLLCVLTLGLTLASLILGLLVLLGFTSFSVLLALAIVAFLNGLFVLALLRGCCGKCCK